MEQARVPKTTKEKNLQIAAHAQLFKAARKGNLNKIKQLVTLPYLDINSVDAQGNSALHLIKARTDDRACAITQVLLEHGANVHKQNQKGETPLHALARRGYALAIAALLEHGAVANAHDAQAHTPLFYSALQPTDAFKVLLESNAPFDKEIVTTVDDDKNTTLHVAASAWDPEIIPIVASFGVEINAQNKSGATALHKAVMNKRIAATRALIKAGALLDIRDKAGDTPLHIAVKFDNEEIEEELVNAGARLDIKNKVGIARANSTKSHIKWQTRLKDAITKKEIDTATVKKLLDQGLNPNCYLSEAGSTKLGKSHLSIALSCGNGQAVCLLLDAGADPYDNVKGLLRHSLCIQTLKDGTVDMAQLLITHVPKILIAKRHNALREPFKTMLMCVKRIGTPLPLDLRKLLFGQCMIDALIPELEKNALEACKDIPWDSFTQKYDATTKDKFDCGKLAQYHSTWKEQIMRATCVNKKTCF